MVGEQILAWIDARIKAVKDMSDAQERVLRASNKTELDNALASLPDSVKQSDNIKALSTSKRLDIEGRSIDVDKAVRDVITTALDGWIAKVGELDMKDPAKAKDNLAALSAKVIEVAAATAVIDTTAGAFPNGMGTASSANTKQMLAWLGFGAVLAAVAHDPVKIGVLRPYQDSLEATFRNRRPGDIALFQAYRTRELSPVKIDDLSKLDDAEMNRIEADNDAVYYREIAKWGYSEWFATALSRSATRTLNFSQLVTLARAGIYDKGLAIYSLWGEGLDRVVMPAALKAIETLRDREMYAGFRSMIEPSYVEGDISEEELREYWNLAGVPVKVQDWVIVRLRKRREKAIAKAAKDALGKERDLTQSQISTAYVDGLIKREKAKDDIIRLGYDAAETELLLQIADARIKTPSAAKLKRLPLSDYEKAWKNKLISADAVIARMTGEYDPRDIELEKQLMKGGKA